MGSRPSRSSAKHPGCLLGPSKQSVAWELRGCDAVEKSILLGRPWECFRASDGLTSPPCFNGFDEHHGGRTTAHCDKATRIPNCPAKQAPLFCFFEAGLIPSLSLSSLRGLRTLAAWRWRDSKQHSRRNTLRSYSSSLKPPVSECMAPVGLNACIHQWTRLWGADASPKP